MLRLVNTKAIYELCHFVASCVPKRKAVSFLPVSHHLLTRHFNTGRPVWKDAFQPSRDESADIQTVDLDKWKSVMRSKAAAEEKQRAVNEDVKNVSDDEDDDDDDDDEPGGDSKSSSSLEATRELVAMWRLAGKLVPEEMTDEEVQVLSELSTKSSRKKYLKYLALREGHKKNRKQKQKQKKIEREASIDKGQDSDATEGGDQGGLGFKNTLFLQYWSRSLDKHLAWRSAQAMLFGQPLVFDMSYDSYMSRRELENTIKQLMDVEGFNRRATDPYHLHFCNLQADGAYQQELLKRYGAETWEHLFITSTHRRYVDVFPHERLVYLTADSPNVLRTFDHSKVYIIGALVDRCIQTGLSLANAKRLKLATARLPLDAYLHWEMGAKNLTLDQMFHIMLSIKDTGKWEEALKFVPKRKHQGFYQQCKQEEISNQRFRRDANNGPREENGDRWLRSGQKTFKNEGQSLYRSNKQSEFTSGNRMAGLANSKENKPAATRVRTSVKGYMEGKKGAGKRNPWWDDK